MEKDKWIGRAVSILGREVMVKSVLQAIPTFIMSCFLISQCIIQMIESAI